MFDYDPYDILGIGLWQDAEKEARRRYGEQDRKTFLKNAKRILKEMKNRAKSKEEKKVVKREESLLKRMESKLKEIEEDEKRQRRRELRQEKRDREIRYLRGLEGLQRASEENIKSRSEKEFLEGMRGLERSAEEYYLANSNRLRRQGVSLGEPQRPFEIVPIREKEYPEEPEEEYEEEYPEAPLEEYKEYPSLEYERRSFIPSSDKIPYIKKSINKISNKELKRQLDRCELQKKLELCKKGILSYLQPSIIIGEKNRQMIPEEPQMISEESKMIPEAPPLISEESEIIESPKIKQIPRISEEQKQILIEEQRKRKEKENLQQKHEQALKEAIQQRRKKIEGSGMEFIDYYLQNY